MAGFVLSWASRRVSSTSATLNVPRPCSTAASSPGHVTGSIGGNIERALVGVEADNDWCAAGSRLLWLCADC